jgi:hypothetical protein
VSSGRGQQRCRRQRTDGGCEEVGITARLSAAAIPGNGNVCLDYQLLSYSATTAALLLLCEGSEDIFAHFHTVGDLEMLLVGQLNQQLEFSPHFLH